MAEMKTKVNGAGQGRIRALELVADGCGGRLNFIGFFQPLAEKDRPCQLGAGRNQVRLRLRDRAPNQAGLLRGCAENGRLGIFSIQIGHDGERLVEHEASILQGRHLSARV